MIKESKVMKNIHKIREEFSLKTRRKKPEYILKLIKQDSQNVKQELENVISNPSGRFNEGASSDQGT